MPVRVKVPVPFLVSVETPPVIRSKVMSPVPPTRKLVVPCVSTPVMAAGVALLLISAPMPLTPEPEKVKPSPMVWPLRSSVAPALTVVAPAVVPRAFGWLRRRMPPLTVVAPV